MTDATQTADNRSLGAFKPGYDPRRHTQGPKNPAVSYQRYLSYLNTAREEGKLSYEDLERIRDDKKEPEMRAAASASLLRTRTEGFAKNGKPFAAWDLENIQDRLIGKPKQHVELFGQIETAQVPTVAAQLATLLAEFPSLAPLLKTATGEGASLPGAEQTRKMVENLAGGAADTQTPDPALDQGSTPSEKSSG